MMNHGEITDDDKLRIDLEEKWKWKKRKEVKEKTRQIENTVHTGSE